MVVGRRHFDPCPPSPARAALDLKAEEYILTWLTDLAARYPDLLADLPGYSIEGTLQYRLQNFCFSGFYAPRVSGRPSYGGPESAQD